MTAALPVLTGHEFDLVVKVSVIWWAVFLAGSLIVALWVKDRRETALRADDDLMAVANAVQGPAQERLP